MELDKKTRSLVAVAAAVGANCLPCFRWHFKQCLNLGIPKSLLKRTIELANVIKGMPKNLFDNSIMKIFEKYGISIN